MISLMLLIDFTYHLSKQTKKTNYMKKQSKVSLHTESAVRCCIYWKQTNSDPDDYYKLT